MAYEIDLSWDAGIHGASAALAREPVPVGDALVRCVRERGHVDIARIADLSGLPEASVVASLGDAAFLDPETLRWELGCVYLTGNLCARLEAAREASRRDPSFLRNVAALEREMPPRVATEDIHVQIGSPWLPEDVILDFVHHLLPNSTNSGITIVHDALTGTWNVRRKERVSHWVASQVAWGTKRMPALRILEATLNGRDVRVFDEVEREDGRRGTRLVINHAETMAALEKQAALADEFCRWVWEDDERKERLERIFHERYCSFVTQRFDGSMLRFEGMSDAVCLRPYQRDAVMRMLLLPTVLLAHDVGAGKTYTCIAAGMEMRRIDASERLLYVVPNNVVGQWAELFRTMYPASDVLVVEPGDFTRPRRERVLAEIASGAHDATIMAASCFDLIPVSRAFRLAELDRRLAELDEAIADGGRATTAVKVERNTVAKRRKRLVEEGEKDECGLTFDALGVTRLFVDEAHNYKNLPVKGAVSVAGIHAAGSRKCAHLLDAVRHTMRQGGGVVFATGTVLTNSIADCYAFQRYLQPFTLAALEIEGFEAWANMFCSRRTDWEIDVDTSAYRLSTHFSGFGNLEGLSAILANVADFHHLEQADGLPAREDVDVVVGRAPELADYLADIAVRADRVRRGQVSPAEDNLLKICGDGRKAALDVRLVAQAAAPGDVCKVAACAERVAGIWHETRDERLTQIVFCDISTPREGFNVYDELKATLVGLGVTEGEIAFVHDARTKRDRDRLFDAMRQGTVRVLVGSTPKLGIGVNVQDRLVAAHHLDVPWRPADMTQREGRALREGNACARVHVFRYVTEGSFDAYSWQLLERKQRIIDELLSGTFSGGRLDADVGDAALTYGEVKALAVGNPLLRERVEVANEIERTRILQRHAAATRARLAARARELAHAVDDGEALLESCEKDVRHAKATPATHATRDDRRSFGERVLSAVAAHAMAAGDQSLGTYRGFRLYVPAWLDPAEPRVTICRSGRWDVDLKGARALGVLTRIDNVIDGLARRREDLAVALEATFMDWEQAEAELEGAKDVHADDLERLRARLAAIDLSLDEQANR